MFDKDDNGVISSKDFNSFLKKFGLKKAPLERNYTFEEFLELYANDDSPDEELSPRELFNFFDKDGNQSISMSELQNVMTTLLGDDITDHEIE